MLSCLERTIHFAICIAALARYVSLANVGKTSSRRVLADPLVPFLSCSFTSLQLRALRLLLVIASVASLDVLRQLRSVHHLRFRYTFVALVAADAAVHMGELCDGHSVWQLDIGIAMQRCVHGRSRAIQTFVILWSVQRAYPVTPARCCHPHGLQQALAENNRLVDEPLGSGEVPFAFSRIVCSAAMRERHPLAFRVDGVHMEILCFVYALHVLKLQM